MNVEVSESALVDGLAEMLRGFGYAVVRTGRQRLYVDLGAEQRGAPALLGSAELELDLYLRVWRRGIRARSRSESMVRAGRWRARASAAVLALHRPARVMELAGLEPAPSWARSSHLRRPGTPWLNRFPP